MLFRPRKDAMFDPSQPLPSTLEACHAQMRVMMATIGQQQATIEQQQTLLESLQRDLALL
jgi:multidrug resistance efflux pump